AFPGGGACAWICFINLPVGVVAVALAIRLLPSLKPERRERMDVLGVVLLSGGLAVFLYGLAEVGRRGSLTAAVPVTALMVGLALVGAFVWHALRSDNPLLDVRLFAQRNFGAAAATNLLLGVALFRVALLLPLYFQIVRARRPRAT